MLKNWEQVIISPNDSIYEAISIIDKYASQIALVKQMEMFGEPY